jgi:hypothetical protein
MRVTYLIEITVIENKMRLVKRIFAELVSNAAGNDKSAHPQVRQNENVEASSACRRDFCRPWQGSLASTDDAGLAQPAYIVGIETEFRSEDRVAIFP